MCQAPALLPGENGTVYRTLLQQICEPYSADPIAWMLARTVADLSWDTLRWRRARAAWIAQVLTFHIRAALSTAMEARGGCPSRATRRAYKLVERWRRGDEGAQDTLDELMREAGVTFESLLGKLTVEELEPVERFAELIYRAENQRSGALRQLSSWNGSIGADMRRRSNAIIDAGGEN